MQDVKIEVMKYLLLTSESSESLLKASYKVVSAENAIHIREKNTVAHAMFFKCTIFMVNLVTIFLGAKT